jgi:hypothetical protein
MLFIASTTATPSITRSPAPPRSMCSEAGSLTAVVTHDTNDCAPARMPSGVGLPSVPSAGHFAGRRSTLLRIGRIEDRQHAIKINTFEEMPDVRGNPREGKR